MDVDHLATALRRRSFLISDWPWRALLFLLTSAMLAAPLAAGLWLLLLPWLAAGDRLLDGVAVRPPVIIAGVLTALLFGSGAPLIAVPVAALERWRLRLIDERPVHVTTPFRGVNALYRDEATWRAVLYISLLALLFPPLSVAAVLLVALDLLMILGPFGTPAGVGSWQLGPLTVDGLDQSIPISVAGVLLVPVLCYLFAALAAGHAWVLRRLLGGGDGLRSRLTEVSRSRARLADAFDAERRRIERDLHDGAQHRLTSLTLQLGMARLDLPDDSPATEPLDRAHSQAKELMVVLRDLIHGIRPQTLGDLGLPAALRELATESPTPVQVRDTGITGRLPELIESTAYFVAAEGLTNAARHAGASQVEIRLTRGRGQLVLEIQDDGRGGADPAAGTGLTGLADRVEAAGGRLLLASPVGGPTLLRVEMPCP